MGTHSARSDFFDAVLDWERHRVYLSFVGAGSLESVDLTTGTVATITTGHRPERMDFDPYRDEIVVVLPDAWHTSSSSTQDGYLGIVDAITGTLHPPIALGIDPWDAVADGFGRSHVTSAAASLEYPITVDLDTGAIRVSARSRFGSLSSRTTLALHPARDRAYGVSPGSWVSLSRVDLAITITPMYRGMHGGCGACASLRIAPGGHTIYASSGGVFLATDVMSSDMTLTGMLPAPWTDIAFRPDGTRAFVITSSTELDVYDTASLSILGSVPLRARPARIFAARDYLVILYSVAGPPAETHVEVRVYPAL